MSRLVIHLQTGLSWALITCNFEPSGRVTVTDASIRLQSAAQTAAVASQVKTWRYVCLTTEAEDRVQTALESGGGRFVRWVLRLFPSRDALRAVSKSFLDTSPDLSM